MPTGLVDHDITPLSLVRECAADELTLDPVGTGDETALVGALHGAAVLVTTSRLPVSERVLRETELDLVAKLGTGVDNIDFDAARENDVTVTYTPGLNALAVAEHTVALLLSAARHVPHNDAQMAAGGWRDEAPMGRQVHGSTVGIVGFGNVGSRVASLLSGFQVETLGYDPYVRSIAGEPSGTTFTDFEDLLERSDTVVVTAELTDETRGMVDAEAFATMKDDALLVTTSRGPIVEEAALLEALRDGSLGGAALDVFETEPLPADSPLHEFDTVITTPHAAAMTMASRERTVRTLLENVNRWVRDEAIPEAYLADR